MEEIHFKNSFVRGIETAKQIYFHWFYKQPLMLTVHIIMALSLILNVYNVIIAIKFGLLFTDGITSPLFLVLFNAVFEIAWFFSCRSQINAMVKRDAESFDGEPLCDITVTDSEMAHCIKDTKNGIPLSKIKRAFATRDYMVLVSEANLMYILKKDSFTLGDAKSFWEFLKEKQIKLKGKI